MVGQTEVPLGIDQSRSLRRTVHSNSQSSTTTSSAVFTMKWKYSSQTCWHQISSCIMFYYHGIGGSISVLRYQLTCISIILCGGQLLIPHCYGSGIAAKMKNLSSTLEVPRNCWFRFCNHCDVRPNGGNSWYLSIKVIEYCSVMHSPQPPLVVQYSRWNGNTAVKLVDTK